MSAGRVSVPESGDLDRGIPSVLSSVERVMVSVASEISRCTARDQPARQRVDVAALHSLRQEKRRHREPDREDQQQRPLSGQRHQDDRLRDARPQQIAGPRSADVHQRLDRALVARGTGVNSTS